MCHLFDLDPFKMFKLTNLSLPNMNNDCFTDGNRKLSKIVIVISAN